MMQALRSFMVVAFAALAAVNVFAAVSEHFGWWGNPAEQHIGHISIALIWLTLVVIYKRVFLP